MDDLSILLRPEAGRLARELYEAFPVGSPQTTPRSVGVKWLDGSPRTDWQPTPWEEQAREWRARLVDAHAALLADLSRPASMDHAARLLAERVGVVVGATAPRWWLQGGYWHLGNGRQTAVFCGTDATNLVTTWDGVRYLSAPYLAGVTDAAAALAAALVAVGGGA